ncbi:Gfo/Idh/MocA family protein [Actinacidiphila oryziradicis]|uniref:Gfo/Idh/MocA family oxidoreductase n=1 Tax=Actinacidiphila oryziradicis TaxID=2571141 RepID=A0A4U0S4C8_9ACTN|nr:Gfo/Idh/MocA family oxidoreductase [Actinacidiphila oryziradicis]TKA02927.1 Gfo/Idh/MocA family oxidoreductase [Actinacidiphila oryziradicis]
MPQLEIALIGAGLIARLHLDSWLRLGATVRVYSVDGRDKELAAEFGATAADSLADALAGADVVDICTPTATHREIAMAAIAAGAHIVCEKPLSAVAAEAEKIVQAAEAAGLRLYPAHDIRYAPAFARLHELVADGSLGTGTTARFTVAGYHPRPWSGPASAESGGILTDQLLHGVDLAYWVFGDVVRVHAHYQGDLPAPAPEGAAATGTVVLTHASGALSQIVCRWTATPQPSVRVSYHVSGTGGTVAYDSQWPQEISVTGDAAGIPGAYGESVFDLELREFSDAFLGGPPPRLCARDALATTRITAAAAESAWTGRVVEIPVLGVA